MSWKRLVLAVGALVFVAMTTVVWPAPVAKAKKAQVRWKIDFDGSGSKPVLADGRLLVGSSDGAVYALDPGTGRSIWRFQTGEGLVSGPEIIMVERGESVWDHIGDAMRARDQPKREIEATPIIEGGVVYVGSKDHHFYALDARTGEERWSFETGGKISKRGLLENRIVYFVSGDGFLYAIDRETGELAWRHETLAGAEGRKRAPSRPFLGDDGVIYLSNWTFRTADSPGTKVSLDAVDSTTGDLRWIFEAEGGFSTAPIVAGGVVLFAMTRESVSFLQALDARTGEPRWHFEAPHTYRFVGKPPAVAGNLAYFATDRGVFGVDLATGQERWSLKADVDQKEIIMGPEALFVVTSDGQSSSTLHALDPVSGQERWSTQWGRSLWLSPPTEGVLVVRLSGGSQFQFSIGSKQKRLAAVDTRTGEELWSLRTRNPISADPLLAEKMALVVSRTELVMGQKPKPGALYCVELPR